MKSKRKFLSIFAILFALVFALSVCFFAACGKKDDDEKDNDTTTEQDETTGSTDETEDGGSGSGETATVTGVSVTPTELPLVIGVTDTGTLTASVTMSDESPYDGTYAWTSSDTDVATVSDSTTSTATVTAIAAGEATITVTAGGKDATCTVTVSEPEPIVTTVTSADELTAALSEGGVIELNADIVGMFTVSADTTLDLAGHSITDKTDTEVAAIAEEEEETTQYTVTVAAGASLTVKDTSDTAAGSIVCTYTPTAIKDEATNENKFSANENSHEGAAIYTCGTLNIVGGTIKSSSVGILAEDGTATITGGNIDTEYYTIFEAHGTVEVNVGGDAVVTGARGIYVGGDAYYGYGLASEKSSWDNDADCTLNIYGDAKISTTFGSAISTLGYTGMNTAKINISGGTISGRPVEYEEDNTAEKVTVMPAIYLPNGILNISGGTIEGTTAVEVRGGTANITGGTIKRTAGTQNTPAWNGSGATSYGYAVAVYSYNTVTRPDTNQAIDNTLNVTISGGTIDGPLCETWKDTADVPEYTFSVTGGTFTEDPTEYVSEVGYVVIGYTAEGQVAEETDTVAYYSVEFDSSIFAVYFDFTGDAYSEILSETRTHVEGGVAVDSEGIFTVISEVKDDGKEKVAIKNGGLNFGGGASSNVNVTLDLSSFSGKNITICYTAYNNDGSKALTTCINSSASTSNYIEGISLAEDKTVGTLTYTVDITEGNQTLYIASENKVVMLTFWILVNGETQTET